MSLDRHRIRQAFSRAASAYEQTAVLQQQVGDLLLERLHLLKSEPARVLDVGAGTGRLTGLLKKRIPQGTRTSATPDQAAAWPVTPRRCRLPMPRWIW